MTSCAAPTPSWNSSCAKHCTAPGACRKKHARILPPTPEGAPPSAPPPILESSPRGNRQQRPYQETGPRRTFFRTRRTVNSARRPHTLLRQHARAQEHRRRRSPIGTVVPFSENFFQRTNSPQQPEASDRYARRKSPPGNSLRLGATPCQKRRWRRRESNPRPATRPHVPLRA